MAEPALWGHGLDSTALIIRAWIIGNSFPTPTQNSIPNRQQPHETQTRPLNIGIVHERIGSKRRKLTERELTRMEMSGANAPVESVDEGIQVLLTYLRVPFYEITKSPQFWI